MNQPTANKIQRHRGVARTIASPATLPLCEATGNVPEAIALTRGQRASP